MADLGSLARQSAGLVEQHRVDFAQQVERAPVFDQNTLLRAERQCRQHCQRCRHTDAGSEVAVDDRHGARRAQRGQREPAQTKRRNHRLVGEPLALVLRGELVAGAVVQDLGDLRGRGLAARFLDRDMHLAGDHDGRCKDAVTHALLGRHRLARQCVLVDHRQTLDDDAVDRHHLAGVDSDDVALVEPVERHLDLDTVLDQPDIARLFAESPQQQLFRVVLGPADQVAADRQAPGEDRTRKYLQGREATHDDDRVEDVDTEPVAP